MYNNINKCYINLFKRCLVILIYKKIIFKYINVELNKYLFHKNSK